jgi:hypothetical protein
LGQWYEEPVPLIYTNRIRGNGSNDIFAVGDFGIAVHHNGIHWRVYNEIRLPSGNYESLSVRGNIVIAVGWQGNRAIVAVGKR